MGKTQEGKSLMAHGAGPRASKPYQAARTFAHFRRSVLKTAQATRIMFIDGIATEAQVKDTERWAAAVSRRI